MSPNSCGPISATGWPALAVAGSGRGDGVAVVASFVDLRGGSSRHASVSSALIYGTVVVTAPRLRRRHGHRPGTCAYNFIGMRYQLFPAALLLFALLVPVDLARGAVFDAERHRPVRPLTDTTLRSQRLVVGGRGGVDVRGVRTLLPTTRPFVRVGPTGSTKSAMPSERAPSIADAAEVVPISPPPAWVVEVPCSSCVVVPEGRRAVDTNGAGPLILSAVVSTVVPTDAAPSVTAPRSRATTRRGSLAFVVVGTLVQLPRSSRRPHVAHRVGRGRHAVLRRRPARVPGVRTCSSPTPATPTSCPARWPRSACSCRRPGIRRTSTLAAALSAALAVACSCYFASAPLLRSRVRQAHPRRRARCSGRCCRSRSPVRSPTSNGRCRSPVCSQCCSPVERPLAVARSSARSSCSRRCRARSVCCSSRSRSGTRCESSPATLPRVRLVVPVVYGAAAALQLVVFATAPHSRATRRRCASSCPTSRSSTATKVAGPSSSSVCVLTEDLWDAVGLWRGGAGVLPRWPRVVVWRLWRATRDLAVGDRGVSSSVAGSSSPSRCGNGRRLSAT